MDSDPAKLPSSTPGQRIGLLAALGASIAGIVFSANADSVVLMAICMALAIVFFVGLLIALLRLFRSGSGGYAMVSVGGLAWLAASTVFWFVFAGLAILAFGYGMAVTMPDATPLLIYALAFLTIVLAVATAAAQVVRRRRTLLVLTHLSRALELNLPLSRMMLAAADSEQGALRVQLMALYDYLDRGKPLDEALAHAIPNIPDHIIRTARVGQRIGRLPHLFGGLIGRRVGDNRSSRQTAGVYRSYPVILLAVVWVVIVFVLPKFQVMFHDFRIELPLPTRLMAAIAERQTFLVILLPILVLVPLGRGMSKIFPSFRSVRPFGGAMADYLLWWTPGVGGFILDRSMSDLCDLLATGIEAGHPLSECLQQAGDAQANAVMRSRVRAWSDGIARGQSTQEAARFARLPGLFVSMLATARDGDGLVKVLVFLWRHYEYRCARLRIFLQAAYVPAVVLLMGALVAIVGLALFEPMVQLNATMAHLSINGGL